MTISLLFAQAIGAWHGVAHAMRPGAVNASTSLLDTASASATGSAQANWLDALFAHHLKGNGHVDCFNLDHSTHAHGLPTVLADMALLALLDAWEMPLLAPTALAYPFKAFNARAPPVLA